MANKRSNTKHDNKKRTINKTLVKQIQTNGEDDDDVDDEIIIVIIIIIIT